MDFTLPQAYLLGLIALLSIVAVVVGRQVLRVRRDEARLAKLELECNGNKVEVASLYELGSVQLYKRLFAQAVTTLKKAVKQLDNEPEEVQALVQNALGFALAAQQNHNDAIRHYRLALKAKAEYPVALNNMAYSLEKQQKLDDAIIIYTQVLKLEAKNSTAIKRLKLLKPEAIPLKS
jgi:tetratricopeptide (TPR) repeat protein